MKKLAKFFTDNGLLIVFTLLFLVFLAGQAVAGRLAFNQTQAAHGLPSIGFREYVGTGNFLQGMFSNWQAAILQLASLIIFGVFLRQRGAPHSRAQKKSEGPSSGPRQSKRGSGGDKHTRSGKTQSWIYDNSLSIAFASIFVAIFCLHVFSGVAAYNQQRALIHQPPLSAPTFFVSSTFWFSTLQTWEAEYMAIALYLFLSIFLRQERSPESKPADAPDSDTGDANQ
jgi:hypothetical protein